MPAWNLAAIIGKAVGWLASRGADEDVSGVGSVVCEVRAMLGLDCHQHAFERLYYVRLYFASSNEWG